ncbi:hypothetical protein PUNSTDRAFT_115088 [Punctularia strigosozonata HHB-11173 SS5]|uniref:uncharacterized protein n=1 Tax=Punctularia strigosozonata (strain HHB-11173) TaxID=741275 RepID=UPI0004418658|nr:uncharacterized protein PUNSTDRAFT_115088 [Punctularia strigosozonata HHB-11173 SS5]EIN06538.1 hypothetical protein PUNSTDRAFT_115088 [Punctularia strigosozonata HHB-11173 SS5]
MSGSSPVSHIEPSDARHQQLPHGIYQLIDIATGSALDLSGADSTTLIAWSPHDGHNQLWDVAPSSRGEDGGLYLIRSVDDLAAKVRLHGRLVLWRDGVLRSRVTMLQTAKLE